MENNQRYNAVKTNNVNLDDVERLRIFGVDISANPKWNQDINDIANKVARKFGFLNRCRKYFKAVIENKSLLKLFL